MDLDEMLRVDKCRDMDELINFDPDYSPDAGTGLLSPISYKRCYADFLRRENPIDGAPLEWAVVLNGFIYSAVGKPLSEVNALYRVPFWFSMN